MNTETGRIYRTPAEIKAAMARGEPLAPVSEEVAKAVETGMRMNRKRRRAAEAKARAAVTKAMRKPRR